MQEQMYQEKLRQAYLEQLYKQKLQERLEQIYRERAQYDLEQLVEARVNQQLADLGLYQKPARQQSQYVHPYETFYYPQQQRQPEYQMYLRSGQSTPTHYQPSSIPIEPKQEPAKPETAQYVKLFVQPPTETSKECCEPKEKSRCCRAKCDSKYKCQKAKCARKTPERNLDAVKSSINSVFDVIEHLMNQKQESQQEHEQPKPTKQESKPFKIDIQEKSEEPLSMIEKLRRNSDVLLQSLEKPQDPNHEVASNAESHEEFKDDASESSNLSMIERLKIKSEAILEQKQDNVAKETEIPVEEIQVTDIPDNEESQAEQDDTVLPKVQTKEIQNDEQNTGASKQETEPVRENVGKPDEIELENHGSKDTLIVDEKMEDLHIQSPKSTASDTFEMVANV
ncbi:hypothetical protein HDV06_004743 [Boothiomyces sp. JEL0866]|nr:hypothetical protein HDV06_004732 [Boothiomyces sp. JEL0866]KAJ3320965.1 hypothetical protein HDV06_004743 [Boothiomyces sp. JEL0866]